MLKRKTSRVKRTRESRQLQLNMSSPRIFGFSCLRWLGKGLRFLLMAGVLVGVGWGAKTGLRKVFIENEEFQLQEIELESNGPMEVADFVRVGEVDPAASVFAITLSEVRGRLEARPGVLRVEVSRRLPGTLKVKVEERIPVAWLECRMLGILARDEARGLLVDEEGVVFPCESWWMEAAKKLPVMVILKAQAGDFEEGKRLRHREAERALQLVRLSRRMLSGEDWRLSVVGVQSDYSLVAVTSGRTVVTFGMDDHKRQLRDLIALLHDSRETARHIERVNLIPERNIPVVYAPGGGEAPTRSPAEVPENQLEQDILTIFNRG